MWHTEVRSVLGSGLVHSFIHSCIRSFIHSFVSTCGLRALSWAQIGIRVHEALFVLPPTRHVTSVPLLPPGLLGGLSEKKDEMRSEPVTEIFVTVVSVVLHCGLSTAVLHCVPSLQAAMAPAHPTQLPAALLSQRKTTRPSPSGNPSPLFPFGKVLL